MHKVSTRPSLGVGGVGAAALEGCGTLSLSFLWGSDQTGGGWSQRRGTERNDVVPSCPRAPSKLHCGVVGRSGLRTPRSKASILATAPHCLLAPIANRHLWSSQPTAKSATSYLDTNAIRYFHAYILWLYTQFAGCIQFLNSLCVPIFIVF